MPPEPRAAPAAAAVAPIGSPGSGPAPGHWLALAGLWLAGTLALLIFRPGYAFPPFELVDSWIYTGYQWDWRNHITEFGQPYYGSRLSWIIPGAFFHGFLPPLTANLCLKLSMSALFAAACGSMVHRVAGLPGSLLAVTLSLFSPQFIGSLHADYVDTPVIVYGTLALACIVAARSSPRWPAWIFAAGFWFAAMVVANLSSIGTPGLGIALFHLLWLRWSFTRQLACVGIYLLAALTMIGILGGLSVWAGGPFYFLKPQVDMMLYFHALKTNPWTAENWLWIYGATWLVLPAATLLWGIHATLRPTDGEGESRRLVQALTGALFVSLVWALQLELKGVGVLVYYYYASYHLCFALPLLATLGRVGSASKSPWGAWLLVPAVILFSFLGKAPVGWTSLVPFHRFLRTPEALPWVVAAVLLLVGLLAARQLLPTFVRRACRPEILVLGLIVCSTSSGFHGYEISDRLRERYLLVRRTYTWLARDFPRGSYVFWVHAKERNGVSLASTKLWGYSMLTDRGFPDWEADRFTTKTIIIPASPGRGQETLEAATRVLAAAGRLLVTPRIIPVPGAAGLGFDLVCFRMQKQPIDPENPPAGAKPPVMLLAFQAGGDSPYTEKLGSVIHHPEQGPALDLALGYPVFHPSSPGDHLATQYHAFTPPRSGQTRELSILVLMPASGSCLCTVQDQNFHTLAQFDLTAPGRSVQRAELPPDSSSLRIVFQGRQGAITPLPTQIRIYENPE